MGFTKTVLKKGNGTKPQQGQTVTVHCTGYGKDSDLAKPFWSTHDEGQQPFSFAVGEGHVIKGMYTAALVYVCVCAMPTCSVQCALHSPALSPSLSHTRISCRSFRWVHF